MGGGQPQPARIQAQILDQRPRHEVQQVGAGRDLEAGGKFARDGCASYLVGSLKHQHRAAAARQVGSTYQSVVTAADDDAVVVGLGDRSA
jgi:hypothetical protein